VSHLLQNYRRADVTMVSGSGLIVTDSAGKTYLD